MATLLFFLSPKLTFLSAVLTVSKFLISRSTNTMPLICLQAKPVAQTFTWGMIIIELTRIYARYFPNARLIRKNLYKNAKSNIYQKVFSLTGLQRFSKQYQKKHVGAENQHKLTSAKREFLSLTNITQRLL